MRRKYQDCLRQDGNCTLCHLVSNGRDCRGRFITRLEWARRAAGIGQKELAEMSGVHVNYIQNVELGKSDAGNLAARNLLALADALGVDPRELI